ncbi:MAG: DUF177 domain-containing protein [Sporomusaceae bacterium]|nr:DUF177 domain-containing protein [Sporomusaceae bacterium]
MLISVVQAKKELGGRQEFSFVTAAEKLNIDGQHPYKNGDIIVKGEVTNLGDRLTIAGTITAQAAYECNRCLTFFERQETISFAEDFREANQPLSQGLGEADCIIYEGDFIDIDELVRENLLLNEPLQPLCSDACLGLCPVCGVNRNEQSCNCNQESIDPRLAILSRLIQEK